MWSGTGVNAAKLTDKSISNFLAVGVLPNILKGDDEIISKELAALADRQDPAIINNFIAAVQRSNSDLDAGDIVEGRGTAAFEPFTIGDARVVVNNMTDAALDKLERAGVNTDLNLANLVKTIIEDHAFVHAGVGNAPGRDLRQTSFWQEHFQDAGFEPEIASILAQGTSEQEFAVDKFAHNPTEDMQFSALISVMEDKGVIPSAVVARVTSLENTVPASILDDQGIDSEEAFNRIDQQALALLEIDMRDVVDVASEKEGSLFTALGKVVDDDRKRFESEEDTLIPSMFYSREPSPAEKAFQVRNQNELSQLAFGIGPDGNLKNKTSGQIFDSLMEESGGFIKGSPEVTASDRVKAMIVQEADRLYQSMLNNLDDPNDAQLAKAEFIQEGFNANFQTQKVDKPKGIDSGYSVDEQERVPLVQDTEGGIGIVEGIPGSLFERVLQQEEAFKLQDASFAIKATRNLLHQNGGSNLDSKKIAFLASQVAERGSTKGFSQQQLDNMTAFARIPAEAVFQAGGEESLRAFAAAQGEVETPDQALERLFPAPGIDDAISVSSQGVRFRETGGIGASRDDRFTAEQNQAQTDRALAGSALSEAIRNDPSLASSIQRQTEFLEDFAASRPQGAFGSLPPGGLPSQVNPRVRRTDEPALNRFGEIAGPEDNVRITPSESTEIPLVNGRAVGLGLNPSDTRTLGSGFRDLQTLETTSLPNFGNESPLATGGMVTLFGKRVNLGPLIRNEQGTFAPAPPIEAPQPKLPNSLELTRQLSAISGGDPDFLSFAASAAPGLQNRFQQSEADRFASHRELVQRRPRGSTQSRRQFALERRSRIGEFESRTFEDFLRESEGELRETFRSIPRRRQIRQTGLSRFSRFAR